MLKPEKSELQTMIESGIALLILSIIIIYFSFQLGVITLDEPAAPIENISVKRNPNPRTNRSPGRNRHRRPNRIHAPDKWLQHATMAPVV